MPSTITITVSPLGRRARYRAYVGVRPLVAGTRTPLLDGGRELARLGAHPDATIVMRNERAGHGALRAQLRTAAKLIEDRCRFRPVRDGDTAPPMRQTGQVFAGGHDVTAEVAL